jgi:hypothetical protein
VKDTERQVEAISESSTHPIAEEILGCAQLLFTFLCSDLFDILLTICHLAEAILCISFTEKLTHAVTTDASSSLVFLDKWRFIT